MDKGLKQDPTHVLERPAQMHNEAGPFGAINHAMIVGQRQRQHQTGHELPVLVNRLHLVLGKPQNGDFRRVDNGRKGRTANASQA